MELHLYKESDFRSSRWSSGCTTELLLLPHDGSYERRNFSLRLSSATVESEQSCFTSLPGFQRWICPLDGYLELEHTERKMRYRLAPYELHSFDGGESTFSRGRVRDFNIISCLPQELHPLRLRGGECRIQEACNRLFIFSYEGSKIAFGSREGSSGLSEPPVFSFNLTMPAFSLLDTQFNTQHQLHLRNNAGGPILILPLLL